jgi:hypothetical protein
VCDLLLPSHFALTPAQLEGYKGASQQIALALGAVACHDRTFVNGQEVGSMNGCLGFRSYGV